MFPPEGTLKHTWIAPGGGYRGQWIWDTMFVVDLLSILPGREQVIRDVFQNYWDFQVRWNAKMPDYAHDMIPCMIEPAKENWLEYPAYSQNPILAWGLERVYTRNGDTQHARFETFDYECNMDGLKMTHHPTRTGEKEGAWYGDICITGNTSFLILAEKSLVRLAKIIGDTEMAVRRQVRIDKSVDAMRSHMWDEEAGIFLSVQRDTLEKVPVATIGSWMPLAAGVPTKEMAARMAKLMRTPSWNTPLPVPTVDRKDKRWESNGFWRGDVWPPTSYLTASGLASYGEHELAAEISDKTVANAIKNGISEHYDSISGKTLGVEYLGMTCTIVTTMLDGLTSKHKLIKKH